MSDFDPYLKWLGIRDPQRPPNHYRLLGLEPFESEADVISGAADRQMAHVRTFQLGPNGDTSQKILGELAEARRCLLNPETKLAYDTELTQQLNQQAMLPPVATAPPIAQAVPPATPGQTTQPAPAPKFNVTHFDEAGGKPLVSTGKPKKDRSRQRAIMMLVGWVSGGLAALGVGYWLLKADLFGRGDPAVVKQESPDNQNIRKPSNVDPKPPKNNRSDNTDTNSKPDLSNKVDNNSSNENAADNTTTNNAATNPTTNAVPWRGTSWPGPPNHWLDPKSDLDKLLQPVRFAIGKRDYDLARNEWQKVRHEVSKIDSSLLFGILANDSVEFWHAALSTARKLQRGDEFQYRGQTVRVKSHSDGQLTLEADNGNAERSFELSLESINRDLAVSLVKIDGLYNDAQINRILAGDFSHYRFPALKNSTAAPTSVVGTDKAPWAEPDWPKPPSGWINPRNEIDKLLQPARIALAKRDFRNAQKEWANVMTKVKELDGDIDIQQDLSKLFRILTLACATGNRMQIGDKFDFLGQEVEVTNKRRNMFELTAHDKFTQDFELRPETINRDLALSLVLHSRQHSRSEIDEALALEYLHFDISNSKLPSFFDKPDPKKDTDPLAPPSMETGVVDVNDPDNSGSAELVEMKKAAVPSAPEITIATKEIESLYSDAFDKNLGYAKVMAAIRSMVDGAASTDDVAMRYVMLSEAHEITSDAGESEVAFETLNLLSQYFEIDYWALARKTVTDVNKKAKTFVQVNDFHGQLLELVKSAIAQKQYKDAASFATKAATVAKKLDDTTAYNLSVAIRNDVREMEKMFERAEKAKITLLADGNDESANLYLGEFLCLVEGDLENGLKHFAKSGNDRYQAISQRIESLGETPTPEDLVAIADSWHFIGKNNKSYKDRQLLIRSRPWYQQVADAASGALKKKAELKLRETEGLELTFGKAKPDGIFNRTWQFDVDNNRNFQAIFFKNGRVQFKIGNTQAGVFPWRIVRQEVVVPYAPDSSIMYFTPDSDGSSMMFRKERARDGRYMSRGTGTPIE